MFYVIAKIEESKVIFGYRVLDVETQTYRDISQNDLKMALESGTKIENIQYRNGEIKGKGGSLDRYAQYSLSGKALTREKVVILGKITSKTYKVATSSGKIMAVQSAFIFARSSDLSNAKVVRNGSRLYVSPISGEFPNITYLNKINKEYINNDKKFLSKIHKLKMIGSSELEHCDGVDIYTDDKNNIQIVYVPENIKILTDRIGNRLRNRCKIIGPSKPTWIGLGIIEGSAGFNSKLLSLEIYLDLSELESLERFCSRFTSLQYVVFSNPKTPRLKKINDAFFDCWALQYSSIDKLDLNSVESMSGAFRKCISLREISLYSSSKLLDISGLFDGCASLTSVNLNMLDTSSTEFMPNVFKNCRSLQTLDLSSFNTEKVVDMHCMFQGCESLEIIDIKSFRLRNNVSLIHLFRSCVSLKQLDISNFVGSTQNTETSLMFNDCNSLEKLDISGLTLGNKAFIELNIPIPSKIRQIYVNRTTFNSIKEVNKTAMKNAGATLVVKKSKWGN